MTVSETATEAAEATEHESPLIGAGPGGDAGDARRREEDGDARRRPAPVSAERLERAALRYLERFAASAARLRRVLMTRVERSARDHGTDRAEAAGWVEALLQRYQRCGLLDDAAYAGAKAASLRRSGASGRAVRGRLAAHGIAPELAEAALRQADDGASRDTADFAAALALARRRRLGRFRAPDQRAPHRARDLATLGRAGFDYETARRVVDGRDGEEGEED
jgi:regulatory protein